MGHSMRVPRSNGFVAWQSLPRIFGCTVDPSWLDNGLLLGWQTCDPLGYTGWVNYEWDAPTRFKATHLSLAWMSQSGG
jgi:hypothetical protein